MLHTASKHTKQRNRFCHHLVYIRTHAHTNMLAQHKWCGAGRWCYITLGKAKGEKTPHAKIIIHNHHQHCNLLFEWWNYPFIKYHIRNSKTTNLHYQTLNFVLFLSKSPSSPCCWISWILDMSVCLFDILFIGQWAEHRLALKPKPIASVKFFIIIATCPKSSSPPLYGLSLSMPRCYSTICLCSFVRYLLFTPLFSSIKMQ